MKNKVLFALLTLSVFFLILTFSIALPIYFRPFYYMHIGPLNLEAQGFLRDEIIGSYNEVLDFLTLPNREFSCGVMRFSPSGAAHFADCKVLITLNMTVFVISAAIVIILFLLVKSNKLPPLKLGKRSAFFYGATAAITVPTVIGILASLNFKNAFNVFHKIFFRGKSNWIFDKTQDEIIKVLPEIFFRNCAVFIGVSILVVSLVIIINEYKNKDVK